MYSIQLIFSYSSGTSLSSGMDYFSRAGNLFILGGRWGKAGDVYTECAQVHLNTSRDLHEAGKSHVLAAKCYKKEEDAESEFQQGWQFTSVYRPNASFY